VLDNRTKRRIDKARDTLVGIVPDPKSQVEQITIALIYKFMADMDNQAESVGGKRSFFAGAFEPYRWENLMSPGMGGHDVLNRYAEAITRMNANPGIPQLFRDIFKNAYLPYRNPETLRAFLKIIDDFEYDHSERLGDAFEYLLSVLGSQGDAGQFRTPRHIIDFMVDIIAPQKFDVILDPACGTAGFLISAWKFIQSANAKGGIPGAALTPDQRRKLARNIFGYDISPDMVRLSLVNMYLHGLKDPRIDEYDTLTSDDKWDETADVILANPPFMSPTGGIHPHSRFSIQAKRSEVLFVDYIAEHLSAKGRAAVIVPEGIIFQSAGAYKNLRKMLVENYLVAVVSLPAGVFNPYSGVKTSILFMDRPLARKAGGILFVKVENDGHDLGAQRRPIDKNDLPAAARQIKAHFDSVKTDAVRDMENIAGALVVGREKVNESTDWNLNGEMYREVEDIRQSDWPVVALGEVATVSAGNSAPQDKKLFQDGTHPFCRTADVGKAHISPNLTEISDHLNEQGISGLRRFEKGTILFPKSGASTFLNHRVMLGVDSYVSSHLATINADKQQIDEHFLFHLLCEVDAKTLTAEQNYPSLRLSEIKNIKIPLPPLAVQREILAEINAHQKLIDGARQVVENYTPRIAINPAWPTVKLGEVCDIQKGTAITKKQTQPGGIPVVAGGQKPAYFHKVANRDGDTVTVSGSGAYAGFVNFFSTPIFASDCSTVKANPEAGNTKFVYYLLKGMQEKIYALRKGMAQPHVYPKDLKRFEVPFPPLAVQREIAAEIEEEEKLIDANRALIRAFEQKIKTKIAAVWGE